MSESRVGSIDEVFEVVSRDFARGDEERVEFECEFSEREFGPVVLPVFGKMREMSGNVKSTVGCKSTKNGLEGRECETTEVSCLVSRPRRFKIPSTSSSAS